MHPRQELFIPPNRCVTYRELRLPWEVEEMMSRVKYILSQTVTRVSHVMYWAPVIVAVYATSLVYLHSIRNPSETNTNNNSITQ